MFRIITVFILLLMFSTPAFAYLDPSTGSMIISAIVGVFASIALAVKTYWYKLKTLFRPKSGNDQGQDASQDDDSSGSQ